MAIQVYGGFGYNCALGKCDFITKPGDPIHPNILYFCIAFGLPCLIIIFSYSIILRKAKSSRSSLRRSR